MILQDFKNPQLSDASTIVLELIMDSTSGGFALSTSHKDGYARIRNP